MGSEYIGSNPANSFTDISTCQIITKRKINLYIDAAVKNQITKTLRETGLYMLMVHGHIITIYQPEILKFFLLLKTLECKQIWF